MSRIAACIFIWIAIAGRTESASFTSPTVSEDKFANKTESVSMVWSYQLASGESINFIRCGYQATAAFVTMVFKQGSNTASVNTEANGFPAEYNNRVEPFEPRNGQIGMNITGLRNGDEKAFRCTLDIGQLNVLTSSSITLKILETPKFGACLDDSDFVVNQGQRFDTNCSATGTPAPIITCYVLDASNQKLLPQKGLQGLQTHFIVDPLLHSYKKIRCDADGQQAGVNSKERALIVRFPPFPPRNFRTTKVTNVSIDLVWEAPAVDGGLPVTHYNIEYLTTSNNVLRSVNTSNVLQYQIAGLTPDLTYTITAYSYNSIGRGNASNVIVQKAFNEPNAGGTSGDDTTLIVAIVVPIVLIIIVVLIVLYCVCCRKKTAGKQKYPTSYVEDATDYPPQKEYHPDSGPAYSNVKKEPAHHNDSTSGYPDIVNQANGQSKRDRSDSTELNNMESRYDNGRRGPTEQEYMSPSYEHSTKEYV